MTHSAGRGGGDRDERPGRGGNGKGRGAGRAREGPRGEAPPRSAGDAVPIGDLVRNLLRSPAHRQRKRLYEEIGPLLRERLGDLADDVKPLSLRSGTLTLGVESAPLLHEIAAFRRDDLLAFLKARLGPEKVRDIRLRHTPA